MIQTTENIKIVSALKNISETKWVGNVTHDSLDKCLTAINLYSTNSGWYAPKCVKISGLSGMYLVNQDGSLFFDQRVIKLDEKKYLIEFLSNAGFDEFENNYRNSF
jgi:hypothetical protein